MQTEVASQTILVRLATMSDQVPPGVSLGQIRMWVTPQKGEHDHDYNINENYFDTLLSHTIDDLVENGYIAATFHDGVEDGDAKVFFLTAKGLKYVEALTSAPVES